LGCAAIGHLRPGNNASFIPVLASLDDLLSVSLGILSVVRMGPPVVTADCREWAHAVARRSAPGRWAAAAMRVAVWLLVGATCAFLLRRTVHLQ